MRRINLSLEDGIDDLLNRTGNKSGYVSTCVHQRWQEWTWALDYLRSAGWHKEEVIAACDALNGTWLLGPAVALEIYDAERLTKMSDKWDISPKRWKDLMASVQNNAELTMALCISARECFSQNEAWGAACERLWQVANKRGKAKP